MAPVVCYTVRRMIAVSDQFGAHVKKDRRLKLTSMHILVI